ncbi:hypothetical protein VOLCADRAFT_119385 [Volvox carteri f. nagariensis]|uniref:START domain-containing protein n=1 Tax=Volvox carteri f. nagariensis TaxID=3068 RepID=D8UCL2_VOLCA|nr:uncharacterized protein VOLCADRAFT_119385 [Volvox carteri f. nagariensis]EFJ42572.1 hypothetical protein VOLCADRAFT_119385 [Volvox carteri f. nagariensis]|eukprot:XP_002956428.1 hypothetical protein VOLCADRAFT_119385 [Volvox carteri f. nagariensis]
MQALLPLHLVTVGVGIAWVVRLAVNSTPKPKGASEPREAPADVSGDADLERSATQWLARTGVERSVSLSPRIAEHNATRTSSYAELELLSEGDFVYLRSGASVLTALVPTVRQLTLQPLQLLKGKPDAVPTAPLEAISVWLVRRRKQEVVFELLGPRNRRHILEADLRAPHGVALSSGTPGKSGLWHITAQGLASVRWPSHVLPLRVVTVQLFDSRTMKSIKDGLGHKLVDIGAKLRQEELERLQAEKERARMETELKRVRNDAASQLDAAVSARQSAEREVAALKSQRADDGVRTKMALARASLAESAAEQAEATVRRQQQQIQGMLAGHAEELRTLQHELQIARDANGSLNRAMREQVIQAQLGVRGLAFPRPEQCGSSAGGAPTPQHLGGGGAAAPAPAPPPPPPALQQVGGDTAGAAADVAGSRGSNEEVSLSSIVGTVKTQPQQPQPPGPPVAEEPPLWRSLLDLTGDLSVTALKESLAMSRRNTKDDGPSPALATLAWSAVQRRQSRPQPQLTDEELLQGALLPTPGNGVSCVAGTLQTCGVVPSVPTRRNSSVGSTAGETKPAAAGHWGSGGGCDGVGSRDMGAADEDGFISAAVRMSPQLKLAVGGGGSGSSTATPLRGQQPQVPGAAAGGVGFPSAAQTDAAGAGPDAVAPRGTPGDLKDDGATVAGSAAAEAAHTPPQGTAPANGSAGAGTAGAAPGHSPALLEYGMEATLTLDSLRRRMRQLDAERERLELLRVSLVESLPWRAGSGATPGGERGGSDGGAIGLGIGGANRMLFFSERPSGGGGGAAALIGREGQKIDGQRQAFGQLESGNQRTQADLQGQPAGHSPQRRSGGQLGSRSGAAVLLEQVEGVQACLKQQHQSTLERLRESPWRGQKEAQMHQAHNPAAPHVQCAGSGPDCFSREACAAGNVVVVGQQQQRAKFDGSTVGRSLVQPARLSSAGLGAAAYAISSPSRPPAIPILPTALSPASRNYCLPEQLRHGSGIGAEAPPQALSTHAADTGLLEGGAQAGSGSCSSLEGAAAANGPDGEDSLSSSCCSSDGHSRISMTSRRVDTSDVGCMRATVSAEELFTTMEHDQAKSGINAASVGLHGQSALDAPVSGPWNGPNANGGDTRGAVVLTEMSSLAVSASAPNVPELQAEGYNPPNRDMLYGLYDSIDGLCNLGSTRAMPTARGAAGLMTARRVGVSQLPSAAGDVPLQQAPPVASPPQEAVACSPRRLIGTQGQQGATATAAAARTPPEAAARVATPKSCASTTGAGDMSADDDGLVLCDEQVPSPPPAMLLGPLDQLRSAGAVTTGGVDGGISRMGGRLLSALEEEDDDE